MITKKQFVEIINKLKKVNDFVNKTNDEARELDDAIESDFFNAMSLSISHESIVVKLLEKIFNDKEGIISWWLYELDYGREYEDGCFIDEDRSYIDVSTAEKLYDYLTKERTKE